jgi:predicted secreted protein
MPLVSPCQRGDKNSSEPPQVHSSPERVGLLLYSGDSICIFLSTIFCGEKTLIRDTVPRIPPGEYMKSKTPSDTISFNDARSKKVIIVAHCILNQNARIDTCASAPSAIPKIPEYLIQHEIGIIQWPCPELNFLGLGRQGQDYNVLNGSYHHEDVELYDQISVPEGRSYLKSVSANIAYQIKEYQRHGFRVLGILGILGSPTCGVGLKYYKKITPGNGALIEELINTLRAENLEVEIKGISDDQPDENLVIIKDWITADS